jgi:hypothetical protein
MPFTIIPEVTLVVSVAATVTVGGGRPARVAVHHATRVMRHVIEALYFSSHAFVVGVDALRNALLAFN